MRLSKTTLFPVVIGIIVLVAISVPYIYAASAAGNEYVFGGFLLNPLDSNSYLAKIYQGWEGNWRNQLAYSADPGEGTYINLFYLFLGHVGRKFGLPLIYVFHGARLLGAVALLVMIWRYYGELFSDQRSCRLAFALATLGSGLGWLFIPSGLIASDLWVAEIYPFLSSITNPHFPLGLAMMLWLILPVRNDRKIRQSILRIFLAWLLSIVSPFGLVVVMGVISGQFVYKFFTRRAWKDLANVQELIYTILMTAIPGAPALLYYYWVVRSDPITASWNAQNVTLSPPVWDLLLSLSPALLFALVGTLKLVKEKLSTNRSQLIAILLIWAGMGLILAYAPFSLQRRFLMGIFIPLAGLTALGLEYLAIKFSWSYRSWVILLFTLSIPSNLVVLLTGFHGAQTHQPKLYLTREEATAMAWIIENTNPDSLVLASPELGNIIPAHTGRRVLYGHPFETINADDEKGLVEQIFYGAISLEERQIILTERGVDYIFCGPREQYNSGGCIDWDYEAVFVDGQVVVLTLNN